MKGSCLLSLFKSQRLFQQLLSITDVRNIHFYIVFDDFFFMDYSCCDVNCVLGREPSFFNHCAIGTPNLCADICEKITALPGINCISI